MSSSRLVQKVMEIVNVFVDVFAFVTPNPENRGDVQRNVENLRNLRICRRYVFPFRFFNFFIDNFSLIHFSFFLFIFLCFFFQSSEQTPKPENKSKIFYYGMTFVYRENF